MITYRDYADDERHHHEFIKYAEKFKSAPRESDLRSVHFVKVLCADREEGMVLDVGCGTGNLLSMVREVCPRLGLHGIDLAKSVIESNLNESCLEGIKFEVGNIVSGPVPGGLFDVVLLNAVFMVFDDEAHDDAIKNISAILKPGGHLVAFDVYNDFAQHLHIVERTSAFPRGISLFIRPKNYCSAIMTEAGFEAPQFYKHQMTKELELVNFEQTSSYTVDANNGDRQLFRGSIFQPWHHLVAKKGIA